MTTPEDAVQHVTEFIDVWLQHTPDPEMAYIIGARRTPLDAETHTPPLYRTHLIGLLRHIQDLEQKLAEKSECPSTTWADNSGKTWDLDKQFLSSRHANPVFVFAGWFNPLTKEGGVRQSPHPVASNGFPNGLEVLSPEDMSGWAQPEPGSGHAPEPPLHSVVKDRDDDLSLSGSIG